MSLMAELRRRKVFKVGAAYLVVAWLLIQVVATLAPQLQLPDWVPRLVTLLLMVGFPVALLLAWMLDVTPEGLKVDGAPAGNTGMYAIAGVLVVAALAWYFLAPAKKEMGSESISGARATAITTDAQPEIDSDPISEPAAAPPGSIAVLPFANRSAEADSLYFADGIHDDLLTQLARNPALVVISRTSVMGYRDTTKPLRQVGAELGVGAVLEGSVQRAGQRVRINAQLIDAATDRHLWAETFDRELSPETMFAIQSEIAAAISTALGRELVTGSAPGAAPTTSNAVAYDLFLRGRAQAGSRVEADIRRTIAVYREAVAADPAFALAMGELGLELTNLYWFNTRAATDRDEARLWIDRALALQPEHPRLRFILARHLYHGRLDYEGALAELAKAEQGLPGSADVFMLRSWIQRRSGRVLESLEPMQTAALLDPRSEEVLSGMVETYGMLGDVENSALWNERMLAVPGMHDYSKVTYAQHRLLLLGDTKAITVALASAPDVYGTGVERYLFDAPYLRRDFLGAMQAIEAFPEDPLVRQFYFIPKPLLRAIVTRADGKAAAAGEHAREALAVLDAFLAANPEDARAWISKARALAILGRGDEAREVARRALALPGVPKDALSFTNYRADYLRALAMVADSEELAREMDDYLQIPAKYWHYDGLMLDPVFDPHRAHPAFVALAARYSKAGGTP